MTGTTDAEIGNLYKRKIKAEKLLLKRRNDGKQLVSALRIIAECFDEESPDAEIVKVESDKFWYSYRGQEAQIKDSRGERDPAIEFPQDAKDIATDIYALKQEIHELTERLNLAIECL